MEKQNNNVLLLIRYSIFFCVALSIVILKTTQNINLFQLIFYLLLYIVNTQIRIYLLKAHNWWIMFSLILEILIICLLYNSFKGFTYIYFFIGIIDASTMLPATESMIMTAMLYIAVIFISLHPDYSNLQNHVAINVIFNTLLVLGFGSMGAFLRVEKDKRIEAEKLYDKIRISEEKLQEANSRLENYSSTVEEITILKERNRISREIHDTVGHTLSTLIIQLQAVPYIARNNQDEAEKMIDDMITYTKTGLEDVRRAVRQLSPSSFDQGHGVFLLRELAINFQNFSKVKVNLNISQMDYDLNSDQSFILYRIFQESFSNSIRHGGATEINITMNFTISEIYLHIKDNGTVSKNIKKGFGINNMSDRIKSIGGTFAYFNHIGSGFEINILIPREQNIARLREKRDE
ncbi:sensor histidine kinase [Clostridium akagii]|uniref:sensor histidine kinase n=1 Tax=Clostridium akagii TaxID=91623 RepID=UPI000479B67E|nr:sensor histidine kinase [Clostridium akagii]